MGLTAWPCLTLTSRFNCYWKLSQHWLLALCPGCWPPLGTLTLEGNPLSLSKEFFSQRWWLFQLAKTPILSHCH